MGELISAFFAYPLETAEFTETIEAAIENINSSNVVHAYSWKSVSTTGKVIIDTVCQAINKCDVFVCDFTYISPNVLFELGYAFAKNKRIWVVLNDSIAQAKINYRKMGLLTTVGYSTYRNSFDIGDAFFNDQPFSLPESPIHNDVTRLVRAYHDPVKSSHFLYLKSEVLTDASIRLTRRLEDSEVHLRVDDPKEVNNQTLTWYAQNVYSSFAVIAHIIDDVRDKDSKFFQNAKYALVAGMAFGFEKHLLMLAHEPYKAPVDYHNLLQTHDTAKKCVFLLDNWMQLIRPQYNSEQQNFAAYQTELKSSAVLQQINLGQYVAENEQEEVLGYFMDTAAYTTGMNSSQTTVFVGRKGTGKTANLYRTKDRLSVDARNHICIIKPEDYEFEGILRLFNSSTTKGEQGYLAESLWKFLIYTELSMSVYREMGLKPAHYVFSDEELEFLTYVDDNKSLLDSEFSVRMENIVQELLRLDISDSIAQQRARISEVLHGSILSDLRSLLGKVLQKKEKVKILVDNLDKSWSRKNDLIALSNFIFGLLSVSQAISTEFQRTGLNWKKVNLSLILFLRSDIFSFIRSEAREPDKMPFIRMDWNDDQLLQRVIEERFVISHTENISFEDVWKRFFVEEVKGKATKHYITGLIIPRPRDMIYICKAALSSAVNRGHMRIEVNDLEQAVQEYSQHAFSSLIAETDSQLNNMESLLYEFAGSANILNRAKLNSFMTQANIAQDQFDAAFQLLLDSLFLGLEVKPGEFEYVYDQNKKRVLQTLARKTVEITGVERYRIHDSFHNFLNITFPHDL